MSGLILSLDIGTSSTRALLYDIESGMRLPDSGHSIRHDPGLTPDGGATLNADALVEEAVLCAARAAERAVGRTIQAVAVATFWHSFVGVGHDGWARTPILLWSDRRSAPQIARLRQQFDAASYTQRTGCPLHTSFVPGRLLWLKENDPAAFTESVRFLSPGEYLFARLFGMPRATCSISMASGSGILHQAAAAWDRETLEILGLGPEHFAPLGDDPVSGLLPGFRERLPQLADIPWFPAVGDGACSNIGCGATTPSRLALMIGTSGAFRVVSPATTPPTVPPGLWRYQTGPGRYLLGGALSNGGIVWAWLKKTMALPDVSDDTLENAIAALPPDGHGLTVLPFIAGERAPLWRDDLRATIHGLSVATRPVEIARAHLEAVAYRFARIRLALKEVAPRGEIIGTGAGLLASRIWAQIITDTLGEPLHLSSEEEASSRGAALLAREALGYGSIETAPWSPVVTTLHPNPDHTALYAAAADRQEQLLLSLLPHND
ncbi:MAG: gluconokinase [Armatimonadaceae bacterium]